MTNESTSFKRRELASQSAWFVQSLGDSTGYKGAPYRLDPSCRSLNLAPSIRADVQRYFEMHKISWHTHANHALSSQVCCLNFLAPLRHDPQTLSRLISVALSISEPEMLPVELGPDGQPWFVGFEWIGGNYLNESALSRDRTRGANATSADAIVKFRQQGRQETLLIEWKYTEKYGAPIRPSGNSTRIARYRELVFGPQGPVNPSLKLDLQDFFYEPFYQLLRQQLLAREMERAREDGSERVRVLHVSPAQNTALKKITAEKLRPFGDDACSAFARVLVRPCDFVAHSTELLFGPLLSARDDEWSQYLLDRYAFLSNANITADASQCRFSRLR
jgi:hypothetical protein